MGPAPKCQFYWDSQVGNLEIPKMGTLAILEAYNFLCKPLIEVRFEENL
jgi:hypothetical protein